MTWPGDGMRVPEVSTPPAPLPRPGGVSRDSAGGDATPTPLELVERLVALLDAAGVDGGDTVMQAREALRRRSGGRPREIPVTVAARIVELRAEGLSLSGVGRQLEAEGIRPARADRWSHQAVAKVLRREGSTWGSGLAVEDVVVGAAPEP